MSIEQKLLDQGAQCVGGQLIFKHKVLGDFKNGIFNPTNDGLAMAEIDDVVVKSETPKKAAKAKKVEPVDDVSLDDLLAE